MADEYWIGPKVEPLLPAFSSFDPGFPPLPRYDLGIPPLPPPLNILAGFDFSTDPDAIPADPAPSADEDLYQQLAELFEGLKNWRQEVVVSIDGIELGRATVTFFDEDPGDLDAWLSLRGLGQFGNAPGQSRASEDLSSGQSIGSAPEDPDAISVSALVNQMQQEQASDSGITTVTSEGGPYIKALPSIGFSAWPQQESGPGISYATSEESAPNIPLQSNDMADPQEGDTRLDENGSSQVFSHGSWGRQITAAAAPVEDESAGLNLNRIFPGQLRALMSQDVINLHDIAEKQAFQWQDQISNNEALDRDQARATYNNIQNQIHLALASPDTPQGIGPFGTRAYLSNAGYILAQEGAVLNLWQPGVDPLPDSVVNMGLGAALLDSRGQRLSIPRLFEGPVLPTTTSEPDFITPPVGNAEVPDSAVPDTGTVASDTAGVTPHKAAAWEAYQARSGEWNYERWSNVYEANQSRATAANEAVDAYHQTLGWGKREVTLEADVNGTTYDRRLDIADRLTQQGVEYKTGYQSVTPDNLWEIARDQALIEKGGWSIKWVFRDTASQPLKDILKSAKIPFEGG
jgi:hypothetical protein